MSKKIERRMFGLAAVLFLIFAVMLFIPPVWNMLLETAQTILGRRIQWHEQWDFLVRYWPPFFLLALCIFCLYCMNREKIYNSIMQEKHIKRILVVLPCMLFLLNALHDLTGPSLWVDETVEFWYSKILFGKLPFEDTSNMYQRIISTYQPPLYNLVMYLWLHISDSEYWFRLFSVIAGGIGIIGVYKTVRLFGSQMLAAFSVLVAATNTQYLYYSKEAAEYCLLLCFLSWGVYFFVLLLKHKTGKAMAGFFLFSILSVYSQYGAAFPVLVMGCVLAVNILLACDKKTFLLYCLAASASIIIFALPLYLFFIKPQNTRISHYADLSNLLKTNVILDSFLDFSKTIRYSIFDNIFGRYIAILFALLFLLFTVPIIIYSKNRVFDVSFACFFWITWIIYYFAVQSSLYAYGIFGYRWGLFFVPILIGQISSFR